MYVQLTKKADESGRFTETDTNKENSTNRAIFCQKHTMVWKSLLVKYGIEIDQK